MGLPERLEFGNEEHIRLVRQLEEEAACREAGLRKWRVGYTVMGFGAVTVEAATAEEARRLVEGGNVDIDVDDWDLVDVVDVECLDGEPASVSLPEQAVFPFAEEGGGDASGVEV